MSHLTDEEWGDRAGARVYIAGSISEAEKVRTLLDRHEVEFRTELVRYAYRSMLLFTGQASGVLFQVGLDVADSVRLRLVDAGFTEGIQYGEEEGGEASRRTAIE
jgi:hypothetical protein